MDDETLPTFVFKKNHPRKKEKETRGKDQSPSNQIGKPQGRKRTTEDQNLH
jgi:hypothetical protein